jgi:hypothetical protein
MIFLVITRYLICGIMSCLKNYQLIVKQIRMFMREFMLLEMSPGTVIANRLLSKINTGVISKA